MIPAVSAQAAPVKSAQTTPAATDQKTIQSQTTEAARGSVGETGAANMRAETVNAIRAAEQSAVAPRLRSGETAENTERELPSIDTPTGPPPAFEESPLERQARVALEPPKPEQIVTTPDETGDDPARSVDTGSPAGNADQPVEPPPSPTERAEASFAETRTLSEDQEPPSIDMSA